MAGERTKWMVAIGLGVVLAVGTTSVILPEIQAHRNYPGLSGVWEGTCYGERVALIIDRTNGTYAATFEYVDAGIAIPASGLKPGGARLRFRIAGTPEIFDASIDPGMKQMAAHWRQGTKDDPFALKRMDHPDLPVPLTEADYAPRSGSAFQGFWRGAIQAGPKRIAVNLRIAEPADGKLRAEMDRVDWGGMHIPASSVSRDGNAVKIGFLLLGSFEGKLNPGAAQISGSWAQDKRNDPATFSRVDLAADQARMNYTPAGASDLAGHWSGMLKLADGKVHFVVHIARLPDGSLAATLDDPDQGQNEVQATSIRYTPPKVSIMWRGIGGIFNGALRDGQLTGTWRQGKVHPLTLTRDHG